MDGSDDPPPDDDGIGYRKPPKAFRFKKGQSGNPAGRPRGRKNQEPEERDSADQPTKHAILSEAYRMVSIREDGEIIQLPAIQAVMRSLGLAGMKGNRHAAKLFADLVQKIEEQDRVDRFELFKTTVEYKEYWDAEFRRCRKQGLPEPDILPHPDDIVIDVRAGTTEIVGPMTSEEKKQLDRIIELRDNCEEWVAEMIEELEQLDEHAERRERLDRMIRQHEALYDLLNGKLVGRYQKPLKGRLSAERDLQTAITEIRASRV